MPTLTTSNSYVTYTEYQAYCDLTGTTPVQQTVIEPKLIQATLAIDRRFGGRFIGRKTSPTQPLQFPRSSTYLRNVDSPEGFYTTDMDGNYRDLNVVPDEVKQATCEAAAGLLSGANFYTQDGPTVTEETKKVDVLQTTKKYQGQWQQKTDLMFTLETILRPLLLPAATRVKFTA